MTEAEYVLSMIDKPYRMLGRGPVFFDCFGIVLDGCKAMGWPVPVDPMKAPQGAKAVRRAFEAHADDRWKRCAPQSGAVACFPRFPETQHVGLVINGGVLEVSNESKWTGWTHLSKLKRKVEFVKWEG